LPRTGVRRRRPEIQNPERNAARHQPQAHSLASGFRRREAPFIEIRVNRVPSFTIVSCEKPPLEKSRGGFFIGATALRGAGEANLRPRHPEVRPACAKPGLRSGKGRAERASKDAIPCTSNPSRAAFGGLLRMTVIERASLNFGRCARRPDRPFFDTKA
jgi:hypothetical protein